MSTSGLRQERRDFITRRRLHPESPQVWESYVYEWESYVGAVEAMQPFFERARRW